MQKFMGGDGMDFIKLTMQNRTGLGGMSIYINVSKIEAIRDEPLDRRFLDHEAAP